MKSTIRATILPRSWQVVWDVSLREIASFLRGTRRYCLNQSQLGEEKVGGVGLGWKKGGLEDWELKRGGMQQFCMLESKESKKESQSMALLEKLIRIDSKDCNFLFRDPLTSYFSFHDRHRSLLIFFNPRRALFKVAYQQTNIENNSNETLLRQLWHHIYAHYFKTIEPEETRRLEYLTSLLQPPGLQLFSYSQSPLPSSVSPVLGPLMREVFQGQYLTGLFSKAGSDREVDIWMKQLQWQVKSQQIQGELSPQARKKTRLIYSKLKQNRKQRRSMAAKAKKTSLQQDNLLLSSLLEEQQQNSDANSLDREISRLMKEKEQQDAVLREMVPELEQSIELEQLGSEKMTYSRNIIYGTAHERDPKDLQCLEYLITSLQEKQIAESVSKIISTERSGGDVMFRLQFQKAMNIQSKLINEKQLTRTNFLRETSLVQFYRTGVKSLYSYLCHNVVFSLTKYVGFRELMQNRHNVTAKLKDRDMLTMMKKGACLASLQDIQHEMNKFSMCHHCKYLYQEHLLFSCRFSSDKQAIPKMGPDSNSDPNLSEAFQEGPHRNRTSQRFMTRKKNCLTSYAKIHDEYVCGRKYCFSCIKDNYAQDNIKDNGLCPFCLGICSCTRCLRNQKIAKFKAMYSILGGDLVQLQETSMIEKLQVKHDDSVQRGRGRPKKYAISHIAVHQVRKKLARVDEKENHWGRRRWEEGRKRNDSGNQTQEQVDPKRRVKRRVGRPRLNRSKMPLN